MMYNAFNADCDSSSRCSTASPAGDSFGYYPSPAGSDTSIGSPQSQDFTDLTVSSASSFVPTLTAISSSADLQWMVQPLISSVAPSHRAHPYTPSSSPSPSPSPAYSMRAQAPKAHNSIKRSRTEQVYSEEEEKRRVRRERNKQAAAKCRNRRRELTDTLQAETDDLEDDKSNLQNDIANLLKEKERLEFILASHRPICKIPSELDDMFVALSPALSPCSTVMSPNTSTTSSSASQTASSTFTSTSHSLFSSPAPIMSAAVSDHHQHHHHHRMPAKLTVLDDATALEESLDLLAKTEMEVTRSVPEVDLSSSLYAAPQDWEPLYTSAGITGDNNINNNICMDFEPLCTPVVTCTPSATTFTSSFVFNYPEADAFPTCGSAHRRGSSSNEYSSDSLSSPTLLAL